MKQEDIDKILKLLLHDDQVPRLLQEIEQNLAALKQIIAEIADAVENENKRNVKGRWWAWQGGIEMTDEDSITKLEKECRRLWLAVSFISFLLAIIAILLTVVAK